MLKLSRLTDYAAVVMAQIARHHQASHTTADLAEAVQLPHPTVSKTLKMLVKAGLLESQRGVQGGYRLARPASQITAGSTSPDMGCHPVAGACDLIGQSSDTASFKSGELLRILRTPLRKIFREAFQEFIDSRCIGRMQLLEVSSPIDPVRHKGAIDLSFLDQKTHCSQHLT